MSKAQETLEAKADAAMVRWVPSAIRERGVVATALGVTGAYTIWWGDGASNAGNGNLPVTHVYPSAKAYTITIKQGDTVVAQDQVFVRDAMAPNVTVRVSESNANFVEVVFSDDPEDVVSKYRIVWEEGAEEEVFAPKGTIRSHGFTAGDHEILVQDLYTGRAVRSPVTVKDPEYDPDFTVAKGADVNTAVATLSKVLADPAKDVLIDWGDGKQTTLPAAKVNDTATHTYASPETYIIQCVYADGSTEGSARVVTIPFAALVDA